MIEQKAMKCLADLNHNYSVGIDAGIVFDTSVSDAI
jgi:hypothetical protein